MAILDIFANMYYYARLKKLDFALRYLVGFRPAQPNVRPARLDACANTGQVHELTLR